MQSNTYACFGCRIAWKAGPIICTRCGVSAVYMGTKWRAPKRDNIKAWTQVANGDVWWDKKAIANSVRIQRDLAWQDRWARMKRRFRP